MVVGGGRGMGECVKERERERDDLKRIITLSITIPSTTTTTHHHHLVVDDDEITIESNNNCNSNSKNNILPFF